MKPNNKVQHGQFFTQTNPFTLKPFLDWFKNIPNIKSKKFIEPFAGANNLVRMMAEVGYPDLSWGCYDLEPKNPDVIQNDSINNFPKGYDICITNPPYLAKNSAKRMKLDYPKTHYDDLYKLSLEQCIKNCEYVAAIIPESFITSGLFLDTLQVVISLNFTMFDDTDCPVCLALFSKHDTEKDDFDMWVGTEYVGKYQELKTHMPDHDNKSIKVKFNDPQGILGLSGVDNTKSASIKFIPGSNIPSSEIKVSSRALTRISFDKDTTKLINGFGMDQFIKELNKEIKKFRSKTKDVFMTSFKGLREDGYYRRRFDFAIAKKVIVKIIEKKLRK
jgi:hypothetical protein